MISPSLALAEETYLIGIGWLWILNGWHRDVYADRTDFS
jgi:hypothetical protein